MSENKDRKIDHVLSEVRVPAKQLVFGAIGMLTKSFRYYIQLSITLARRSSDVHDPSVLYVGSVFQSHD